MARKKLLMLSGLALLLLLLLAGFDRLLFSLFQMLCSMLLCSTSSDAVQLTLIIVEYASNIYLGSVALLSHNTLK